MATEPTMDVEHGAAEPDPTPGQEDGVADSIRVTRHGKMRVWVKKALDFFESHPDRPLVLYSAPADVTTSTIARLVSVVEIIKREYLKARDVCEGDVSGLHQYNQLLFERQGTVPAEDGEERRDAIQLALGGKSHAKQSFAPHMKITLSTNAIPERRETYQAPAIRRMSKTAKARMRKRRKEKAGVVSS